ncbi:MAG: hypothetical protein M3Y18_03115 [Candidatus Eremiobacteraeota bacterium]|nr:hypothetical protein [Candidatus Eremiobacteraeota bacterium]
MTTLGEPRAGEASGRGVASAITGANVAAVVGIGAGVTSGAVRMTVGWGAGDGAALAATRMTGGTEAVGAEVGAAGIIAWPASAMVACAGDVCGRGDSTGSGGGFGGAVGDCLESSCRLRGAPFGRPFCAGARLAACGTTG